MMRYEVRIKAPALKALKKLSKESRGRVLGAIISLAENPRPTGAVKLEDMDGYRIRVGEYRVIYEIKDRELLVLVIKIGHRRDVYRKN